jgi:single-strand DNA-binding protein
MMTISGVGRFVRDPELKPIPANDTHVCEFSLAVNEYRKVGGERKKFAHFFDCVIWDKAAEVIAEYCHKGDMIEIRGTPRQDKWVDTEGRPRSRIVFRVDEFSFLPRNTNSGSSEPAETSEPEPVPAEEDGTTPF